MSADAPSDAPLPEPAAWFLIAAALAMTLWSALFFDQIVVSLRQVVAFALAGADGWVGAQIASDASTMRPWLVCAGFALLGSGVSVGVLRRRNWAARALLLLWFATLPVIGMVIYAGVAAGGMCVGKPALLAQIRCIGVVGALAVVPVSLWLYSLVHIRRARSRWRPPG